MPAPHAPIETREYPRPDLEPDSALLRTMYSEVCGTDVHLHHGRLGGVPYPIIPGHVSVGVIDELRGTLRDIDGVPFREGDVVTFLDVHGTCGNCYECLVTKQTTRCPHRRVYGISYGANDGLLGGWSEAVYLRPGIKLLRMPRGVDPLRYIAGGCGLVTATHAVERGGVRLGQSVVVLGVGPVGQGVVALAALAGAYPIIAVGDPENRRDFATRMGATHTISLSMPAEERANAMRAMNGGRGADVVIEAAGAPDAVTQSLDYVRDGGVVVIAGQYTDAGPISLNPHLQINRKHAEIRGCWGSDYSHFHRALQTLAHRGAALPWIDAVSRQYSLDEAAAALDAVARREVVKAVIAPNRTSA